MSQLKKVVSLTRKERDANAKKLKDARAKYRSIELVVVAVDEANKKAHLGVKVCPIGRDGNCHKCDKLRGFVEHAVNRAESSYEGFCDSKNPSLSS